MLGDCWARNSTLGHRKDGCGVGGCRAVLGVGGWEAVGELWIRRASSGTLGSQEGQLCVWRLWDSAVGYGE